MQERELRGESRLVRWGVLPQHCANLAYGDTARPSADQSEALLVCQRHGCDYWSDELAGELSEGGHVGCVYIRDEGRVKGTRRSVVVQESRTTELV